MEENLFLQLFQNSATDLQKIMDCNQYTEKFGVRLSEQDTEMLMVARKNSLKEQERVEFGQGILPKLIFAFCDSPYVYQDNYVDTLEALQDIFYLYKNESLDELTDDELIEYMKVHFEGECQGSLEYLEDTCLEQFARHVRKHSHLYIGHVKEDYE